MSDFIESEAEESEEASNATFFICNIYVKNMFLQIITVICM